MPNKVLRWVGSMPSDAWTQSQNMWMFVQLTNSKIKFMNVLFATLITWKVTSKSVELRGSGVSVKVQTLFKIVSITISTQRLINIYVTHAILSFLCNRTIFVSIILILKMIALNIKTTDQMKYVNDVRLVLPYQIFLSVT